MAECPAGLSLDSIQCCGSPERCRRSSMLASPSVAGKDAGEEVSGPGTWTADPGPLTSPPVVGKDETRRPVAVEPGGVSEPGCFSREAVEGRPSAEARFDCEASPGSLTPVEPGQLDRPEKAETGDDSCGSRPSAGEPTGGCRLHGYALTIGCPGCDDVADDFAIAALVRERLANDTGERITLEELIDSLHTCAAGECNSTRLQDLLAESRAALSAATSRAERAEEALRDIANLPEPMNNKGAAQSQCEFLKNVARAVLRETAEGGTE